MNKFIGLSLILSFAFTGMAFAQTAIGNITVLPDPATTNAVSTVTTSSAPNVVGELNKNLEMQIKALREEMDSKIKAIRDEYKVKINALKKEVKSKIEVEKDKRKAEVKAAQEKRKAEKEKLKTELLKKARERKERSSTATTTPAQ